MLIWKYSSDFPRKITNITQYPIYSDNSIQGAGIYIPVQAASECAALLLGVIYHYSSHCILPAREYCDN